MRPGRLKRGWRTTSLLAIGRAVDNSASASFSSIRTSQAALLPQPLIRSVGAYKLCWLLAPRITRRLHLIRRPSPSKLAASTISWQTRGLARAPCAIGLAGCQIPRWPSTSRVVCALSCRTPSQRPCSQPLRHTPRVLPPFTALPPRAGHPETAGLTCQGALHHTPTVHLSS
jgi:hypothetical protein